MIANLKQSGSFKPQTIRQWYRVLVEMFSTYIIPHYLVQTIEQYKFLFELAQMVYNCLYSTTLCPAIRIDEMNIQVRWT